MFLGCCCDYLSFRHSELHWQQAFPVLANWFENNCRGDEWFTTKPRI
ncbi:hypothetical protein [Spartinivicinus marinus]